MAGRDQLRKDRGCPAGLTSMIRLAALLFCLTFANGVTATTRDMSIGLAGVVDWSVQQPFLDVMKTARPWIGHRPGQWGGAEYADLDAAGVFDEHGWPVRIPEDFRGIGTVVLTDMPVLARSLAGRYRLQYQGDGIVEISGRATDIRYGEGEVFFDFEPGPGPVAITINKTDRDGTGDYVRDITLVKLDKAERLDAGELFNPDWIRHIADFGTLRFMDWMETNDSTQSKLSRTYRANC